MRRKNHRFHVCTAFAILVVCHASIAANFFAHMQALIAESIFSHGFKGMGEKKLSALSDDVLKALLHKIDSSGDELSKEEIVRVIMRHKRADAAKSKDAETVPKAAFSNRHSIEIVAFNALKLRLDNPDLAPFVDSFAARMAQADILVMSEVPADAKKFANRVGLLMEGLTSHSGERWFSCVSDPSGPGPAEVHLILFKSPIKLVKHVTTMRCNSTALDHSPVTALFEDARFHKCTRFVVTSVHFPPVARAKQRDAQIAAFLNCYTCEASLRCDTPMTNKGAKDARAKLPTHIIAGDFNAWIGDDRYGAQAHGFDAMLGKNIGTTSGRQAFDNFLVSNHTKDNFALSTSVLELSELQNSHKGVVGLSDHNPISMTLQK